MLKPTRVFHLLFFVVSLFLSGCVSVGGIADALSEAILNQPDPETVRDGLPTYLIFIDAMIQDDAEDVALLSAGARLYDAYAAGFVSDKKRAQQMSAKALSYARQALCLELEDLCQALNKPIDTYRLALVRVDDEDDLPVLFTLASVWAGWIQANSSDWQAIADLPKVEATMAQVINVDEHHKAGEPQLYMGVLLSLRPAALGGKPEQGRQYFERAIELSDNKNLMVKVMYARHYARLVFDQELHDRLLKEVLGSSVEAPGLTLINVLAQQQAQVLLDESKEYF